MRYKIGGTADKIAVRWRTLGLARLTVYLQMDAKEITSLFRNLSLEDNHVM